VIYGGLDIRKNSIDSISSLFRELPKFPEDAEVK